MKYLNALLIAIQFLTRLPVSWALKSKATQDRALIANSLIFYPVVGIIIGVLLWVTALAINSLLPDKPLLHALIVLLVWIAITGALHLDGVGDLADAWMGGLGDREKTLAIMKDPYCGPFGVVVIVLVLLSKFVLLYYLLSTSAFSLILVPAIARILVVLLFISTPYVRAEGMASALVQQRTPVAITVAILVAVMGLFYLPVLMSILLVSAGVFFAMFRMQLMKRLGGFTGDTAGAMIEISEVVLMLVVLLATELA